MCSAHCSTAAKRGHCILGKSADSTPSRCAASEGIWSSPDKTAFQTRQSWSKLESRACSLCWLRDACAGSDTSGAWMMVASRRACCMASSQQAPDLQEGLSSATKTFVSETWRQATSTQQARRRSIWRLVVETSIEVGKRRGEHRRYKAASVPTSIAKRGLYLQEL